MNKLISLVFMLVGYFSIAQNQKILLTRQGNVSFFSYTAAENIEAENNQVASAISLDDNKISVQILMRAFVFKKALMQEHFNESYVESDIYPKLLFSGDIDDFVSRSEKKQTQIVKGVLNFHGVEKDIDIKVDIENMDENYILSGKFDINILDYNIKVPALLAPNISKKISINFKFEYNQ